MRAPHSMAFVLALALVQAAVCTAQQADLAAGTRVRLVTPSLQADHQLARIVSADKDSIVFRSDAYPVTRSLAVSDIERIDVSGGSHRQTGRGALMGLAIGGGTGIVLGLATYEPCTSWCFGPSSRGESAALAGGVLGIIGAVTGGLIGAFHKKEEWKPLAVKPTAALTPAGERTFGIQVSHTF